MQNRQRPYCGKSSLDGAAARAACQQVCRKSVRVRARSRAGNRKRREVARHPSVMDRHRHKTAAHTLGHLEVDLIEPATTARSPRVRDLPLLAAGKNLWRETVRRCRRNDLVVISI